MHVGSVATPSAPLVYRFESKAWLTESGELRTRGNVVDLEGEIVRLTADNLPLQRTLLVRHVQAFDRHRLPHRLQEWEERAAIIKFDGDLTRGQAEIEAARCLNLLAFIGERACAAA